MADFWADKYWTGRYFAVRYWGSADQVEGAIFGSAAGSSTASASLTFVDNSVVIVIDSDGKRKRDITEKARRHKAYESARKQSVENAWEKVFGSPGAKPQPLKPTPPQKDRIVSIARRELETAGLEASAKELRVLIDAYANEIKRKKRNRDAMIVLLMAA
jgi:hypothetical protein